MLRISLNKNYWIMAVCWIIGGCVFSDLKKDLENYDQSTNTNQNLFHRDYFSKRIRLNRGQHKNKSLAKLFGIPGTEPTIYYAADDGPHQRGQPK